MKFQNLANLPQAEFEKLKRKLENLKTLGQVLNWTGSEDKNYFLPQIVAEVITQDEYTHDVIIPFRDLFLVFDTN